MKSKFGEITPVLTNSLPHSILVDSIISILNCWSPHLYVVASDNYLNTITNISENVNSRAFTTFSVDDKIYGVSVFHNALSINDYFLINEGNIFSHLYKNSVVKIDIPSHR